MEQCIINLKPGKTHAVEKGNPWIYSDEIENFSGTYTNGDIVEVRNGKGWSIGKGFINDKSKIAIRMMTRDPEEAVDDELIRRRLKTASDYRRDVMGAETSYRLIYGESDFLPGLTVDKYGEYYVIQSLALGIDRFKDAVVRILVEDY